MNKLNIDVPALSAVYSQEDLETIFTVYIAIHMSIPDELDILIRDLAIATALYRSAVASQEVRPKVGSFENFPETTKGCNAIAQLLRDAADLYEVKP